ncbi:tetraprenyl-beta-curcumene synthase family protein [Candidatus Contubernalis alkalaceticus]|nr:tetraprenyl-beta-curcumene synthase family protein [Candidatus Contubernalis alkalaceticus]
MKVNLKKEAWQLNILTRFVTRVFPQVDRELLGWKKYLNACPPGELKNQALASIRDKRFHCQGGSIYALYIPEKSKDLVPAIVALQTISDYLDNLCDRVECGEEKAFRELHRSMIEALEPWKREQKERQRDYYRFYTLQQDGGYLEKLVERTSMSLLNFPSYGIVKERCVELISLYGDLQVYKHLDLRIREEKLIRWFEAHREKTPGIYWWEFSAAAGSTLGAFMLMAASGEEALSLEEGRRIHECYFPWICGLHILLDYFIDQQEDRVHRDLNFVNYYADEKQCRERLGFFLEKSLESASNLPRPDFHTLVVKGLMAMYLSDPKVEKQGLLGIAKELMNQAGSDVPGMYRFCRMLRRLKVM